MENWLTDTLARLPVYLVLSFLPVGFLTAMDPKPDGDNAAMNGVVLAVPAVLVALIVFAPVELAAGGLGLGHLRDLAVPAAGSAVGLFPTLPGVGRDSGLPPPLILTLAWSVLWRLSDWIVRGIAQAL